MATDLDKILFGGVYYGFEDTEARNKQASQVSVSMNANDGSIAIKYADGSTGTGRGILPHATQAKAGLMSAADKKKLDGISSGVFIIDVGSEDNTTDDYKSFCADQNIRERLNVMDVTVPLFVRWWGIDGPAILPVSVIYDSNEVVYTIWGDPLSWWSNESEDANIIAIEYFSEDFVVDGFTSYRKVFATKGSEIAI